MTGTRQAAVDEDFEAADEDRATRRAFRAHTSPAFLARSLLEVGVAPGGTTPSLGNCKKVPTSDPDRVQNRPKAYRSVERSTDAREAILAAVSRDRNRQAKVLALIGVGEVAHARRLALCRRRSVQLRCPEMAGGCGHDGNYVPARCGSRLCPECMADKQGESIGRYRDVVASWGSPTMLGVGLPDRVAGGELESAVETLRDAFGRLRRRVIPPEGSHQGTRWVWDDDGGTAADFYWKPALKAEASRRARASGDRSLFRRIHRWEREYVEEGKGIPFSEVVRSGIYGIDIKEQADGRFNVHLHVLADCPYLPQAALSALWDDVIGAPVVDVRRVEERGESDRETALMETIGYAAKPPQFESVDAQAEYLVALKGAKLIQPFGELHGNTPEPDGAYLRCERCGVSPAWWEQEGVIDGCYSTVLVGSAPDGDRPPPGDGE